MLCCTCLQQAHHVRGSRSSTSKSSRLPCRTVLPGAEEKRNRASWLCATMVAATPSLTSQCNSANPKAVLPMPGVPARGRREGLQR